MVYNHYKGNYAKRSGIGLRLERNFNIDWNDHIFYRLERKKI